jgi:hypothetical protein
MPKYDEIFGVLLKFANLILDIEMMLSTVVQLLLMVVVVNDLRPLLSYLIQMNRQDISMSIATFPIDFDCLYIDQHPYSQLVVNTKINTK